MDHQGDGDKGQRLMVDMNLSTTRKGKDGTSIKQRGILCGVFN